MARDNGNKLQIRLHVYDTDMGVTVIRQDEECYRRAAKLITDTINTCASIFKVRRSEKDMLYMALVDMVLHYKKEFTCNDVTPHSKVISRLTSEIEETLKD